jgi:putative ABC transport system permease protein
MLDGRGYLAIGIMNAEFKFPDASTQFWVPFVPQRAEATRVTRVGMIAQLADGVQQDAASAEINTLLYQLRGFAAAEIPAGGRSRYELMSVREQLAAPARPALLMLSVAVGVVLIIACVNVASLQLARSTTRHHEFAVRTALGAGGGRIVRQVLTESLLLGLLGGLSGNAFAFAGVRLLQVLGTTLARQDLGPVDGIPLLDQISVDTSVLTYSLIVSTAAGLSFGLAPAVCQLCANRARVFGSNSATALARSTLLKGNGARGLLVISEVGLATMLFVSAGLLLRSFLMLSDIDQGYDKKHVLTFQLAAPQGRYPSNEATTFSEGLVSRLQQLPNVQAAAYSNALPLIWRRSEGWVSTTWPPKAALSSGIARAHFVSHLYVKAMGLRLTAGRELEEHDREAPRVMLVNEALARRDFPGEDPLGKTVYLDDDRGWEIVGIVADVPWFGLYNCPAKLIMGTEQCAPEPQFFVDYAHLDSRRSPTTGWDERYFVVRTNGDPIAVVPAIRAIIRQLDTQVAVDNVATMERLASNSITRPRLYAVLVGIFALVAVVLAVIGIYGVVAYSIAQRTHEIGIRIALGARRSNVLSLILSQGAVLTALGILLGIGGAIASGRYLQSMLFGVTHLDPLTFVAVIAGFMLVAMFAIYVPARRATTVDPTVALRCE